MRASSTAARVFFATGLSACRVQSRRVRQGRMWRSVWPTEIGSVFRVTRSLMARLIGPTDARSSAGRGFSGMTAAACRARRPSCARPGLGLRNVALRTTSSACLVNCRKATAMLGPMRVTLPARLAFSLKRASAANATPVSVRLGPMPSTAPCTPTNDAWRVLRFRGEFGGSPVASSNATRGIIWTAGRAWNAPTLTARPGRMRGRVRLLLTPRVSHVLRSRRVSCGRMGVTSNAPTGSICRAACAWRARNWRGAARECSWHHATALLTRRAWPAAVSLRGLTTGRMDASSSVRASSIWRARTPVCLVWQT